MKKITLTGALAALMASAMLLAGCGNSSKANKMEPAEYYSYIENKAVDEGLKSSKSFSFEEGFSADFGLKFALLKEGKALAKTYMGAMGGADGVSDLDWLNNIDLTGNLSVNKGALAANMTGSVNSAKINLDAVMDENSACLRVPELNKDYVSLPAAFLGANSGLNVGEIIKAYTEYITSIPNYEEIVSEVNKYKDTYLKYATDVTKSTSNLTRGGKSQELTVLTVNFEGENAENLVKDILTLAKSDECFKRVISAFENYQKALAPYSDAFTYSKFEEAIDDLLDDMDEFGLGEFSNIKMDVFVDSKDEICGRTFKLSDNEMASYAVTKDGKDFGFELSAGPDGSIASIKGNGKCKGDVYTGDYTLSMQGKDVQKFTIENFDAKALKKGLVKATVKFTPESAAMSAYQFAVDFNGDSTSQKYGVTVAQDSKKLATLEYSTKIAKNSKVKMPSDAVSIEDGEAFQKYTKSLKFDNLNSIIKKIGMPKELEGQLTGAVDGLAKSFAE